MTQIKDDLSQLLPGVHHEQGPTFLAVKQALVTQIGNTWGVGDRLPRIRDIAQAMAVSPNSVQLAVRELVRDGVLSSRRRIGLRVLALPSETATTHETQAGPLMGKTIELVVSSDSPLPFVQHMIKGFRQAMEHTGAILTEANYTEQFPDRQSCWGMVLFNPSSGLNVPAGYRNLIVVTTADHLQADLIARADRVGVDHYQGGMLAGSLLRETGCEQVRFIGRRLYFKAGHRYDLTSTTRLSGFEQTWGQHLDLAQQVYTPGYSINSGALGFVDHMKMSPRPEGVFAASDDLAKGFRAAATAAGLKAGVDYQLVGFDGQDDHGPADEDTLTSVRVPAARMGQAAAQMMLLRATDESRCIQHVAIPCSMIHGRTTRLAKHSQ